MGVLCGWGCPDLRARVHRAVERLARCCPRMAIRRRGARLHPVLLPVLWGADGGRGDSKVTHTTVILHVTVWARNVTSLQQQSHVQR